MAHENGISAEERERRIPWPAGQRLIAAAHESVRERGVAEQKVREGVVDLPGSPEVAASLLSALAQGIAIECLADPEWDRTEAIEQAAVAARYVLGALSPSA